MTLLVQWGALRSESVSTVCGWLLPSHSVPDGRAQVWLVPLIPVFSRLYNAYGTPIHMGSCSLPRALGSTLPSRICWVKPSTATHIHRTPTQYGGIIYLRNVYNTVRFNSMQRSWSKIDTTNKPPKKISDVFHRSFLKRQPFCTLPLKGNRVRLSVIQ